MQSEFRTNFAPDAVENRVITIEELAKQFNVSTKTISRWRQYGLISGRFLMDGRMRVGFLESSVDRFVSQNSDRVRRGAQFSQLTDAERTSIIQRGQRLARAGASSAEIIRRIERKTGRSSETIRYTLKQFDREHAELAIFADSHSPVRQENKRKIYRQYRQGETVEVLARRFCQSPAKINRILIEMRYEQIAELPLGYIASEEFAEALQVPKRESLFLATIPQSDQPVKRVRVPSGVPSYLASLYEVPLLSRAQEAHLFRKMNFLKYKAARLREQLSPSQPKSSIMDQIEVLHEEAVAVKNWLIRANLRLVVSIARRRVAPVENFFELVSDGNMALIRAVDKFDYSRGFKFSTYASWAIMKSFAQSIPNEYRHRDRFRTSHEEAFVTAEDGRSDPFEQEAAQSKREGLVRKILERLDEREQKIVVRRFGLKRGQEPLTLKEVGAELGVTKERIRQIEAKALNKLRKAVEEERAASPL